MKYLSKNNISNKTVLLRCDFNVPVKDNKILDTTKIDISLDTINYLLDNNNKVIIFSHFGRVKEEKDKYNNSLKIVYEYLKEKIDLDFITDPLNIEMVTDVSNKDCYLVENTRLELARYWSNYGDAFVMDAFSSMHRAHSSTAGISKYLPTYIGFLAEKEIENLKPLIENQEHPFTVIMGGAKVDDKIKIIEGLLDKCDKLVLTGGILNTFLAVSGKNIGCSLKSDDEEVIHSVRNILDRYKNKLYFSDLFVVDRNGSNKKVSMNEIEDSDIIYDNIPNVRDILTQSKIVFFNGTCGKYEDSEYEEGTVKLLNDLSNITASVYVGGGDTVSAVNKYGFENAYKYLSSGGGATLEYVAYGKLKALEFIKEEGVEN